MATFDELMGILTSEDEEKPQTIYDDLRNAYQTLYDGSQANLSTRLEEIEKAQAEIMRLKALNFELMMKAPVVDNDDDGSEDKREADIPRGIDGLFRIG